MRYVLKLEEGVSAGCSHLEEALFYVTEYHPKVGDKLQFGTTRYIVTNIVHMFNDKNGDYKQTNVFVTTRNSIINRIHKDGPLAG